MKKAMQLAAMGILACGAAWGQGVATVKVGTSIDGPYYYVDGRQFNTTQVFLWPEGSKHTLQFLQSVDVVTGENLTYQYGQNATVRYTFGGWSTNAGPLAAGSALVQTVTASTDITQIVGQVTVEYKVRFEFFNSTPGDGNCSGAHSDPLQDGPRYGIIYVDGQCIGGTKEVFITAGPHQLNAFPFPGYVFAGWMINGQVNQPFISNFNVTSSVAVLPQFMPAKRVRFSSDPPGLKMIVDGTIIQLPPGRPRDQLPSSNIDPNCAPDYSRLPPGAPLGIAPLCMGDFDFLPGSIHRIGAPQSQNDDTGLSWVFSGFSNGLKNNDVYIPDGLVGNGESIVAKFVPGVPATFLTSPQGLKLEVDGRQNWPNYSFVWGAGEKHRVNAPAEQVDSKGRRYRFVGWSNKGSADQEVTVPNDRFGMTMTASYQILGQVQITSTPDGLKVTVDGTECTTPCKVDRDSGAAISIAAPKTVPNTALTRYDFGGWSNGNVELTQAVTFNTDVQVLHAGYFTSYLLMANSDPAGQATFTYSPASPDGYFAEGTRVSVTAVAKGGYKFRRWDGDLSGAFATGFVSMSSPREVIARLDKVPYIPEAGVKNAAGDTPDGTVAPGSIIAIYGENLAETLEIGRVNPLSQTLGNVTVTVNDRLLPLLFVSPQQINAQVPSDLADGAYTLKVKAAGLVDVSANFTVRRNSPGLYTLQNEQNLPLALALHEDGTPVTLDSPARRRETVSIFGTGFGPYEKRVVDGFIVPDDTLYRLIDPVRIQSGDRSFTPQWTGAAPGFVGTAVLKLKISEDMPAASTLDVVVDVNGVQSNRVQLAVE